MNNQPLSPTCQQTQEAILALLDQDCLDEQAELIAHHLPNCASCQAYQESMQNLTLSLKSMKPIMPPIGLEQRILQSLASAHDEQSNTQQDHPQSTDSSFSQYRKPAAKLGPRLATLAATIMTIALALPLIYQALTPNHMDGFSDLFRQVPKSQQSASLEDTQSNLQSPTAIHDVHTGIVLEQPLPNVPVPQSTRQVTIKPLSTERISSNPVAKSENQTTQTEVASLPSAQSVDNTYASNHEGDIYFDPVSDLVDF